MSAQAVIDKTTGEVIEEFVPETDTELERYEPQQIVSVFGTADVQMTLEKLTEFANQIQAFMKEHDLTLEMEDGSDYPLAEAWEGLGQMMGVYAEAEGLKRDGDGWVAKAFAHMNGRRLTARYGFCSRSEPGKKWKAEHDILAQAQTRACRNALKAALNIVMNAAGYDGGDPDNKAMTPKQRANIFALLKQIDTFEGKGEKAQKDWLTNATLRRFGDRISGLNRLQAAQVISGLEGKVQTLETGDPETSEWVPEDFEDAEAIDL